ncbi:hypothetical protein ACLOJK_008552 [Asimina triloba]
MGCWKSKVLPNIRKIFDKNSTKKTAAEEACRDFDDSRELITLEFEEMKDDIRNKVTEIHAVTSLRTKAVVREPNKAAIKKNSAAVHKFLGELVKIENGITVRCLTKSNVREAALSHSPASENDKQDIFAGQTVLGMLTRSVNG